jgi:hypothetical protein
MTFLFFVTKKFGGFMKLIIIIFLTAVFFYSCKEEKPAAIETFSTEVFAFDIGDSWEVNATTRVKGFTQIEEENNFFATIAYDIDLIKPAGDTIKALISRIEDKEGTERFSDFPIEVQFELDSTYTPGEYKIIFNIKDTKTEQSALSEASFILGDE